MSQQTSAPLLEQALAVTASRGQEFLRLYRPLPEAERFHRSLATERILLGGNRAGKSLSGFCELASAVTGIPITTRGGGQIPDKWPQGRPRLWWVIGLNDDHLASPCYRMLFLPSQFKTVQNADGSWRSWDPETDPDVELNSQPLIPRRFVDGDPAWRDAKKKIPHTVKCKNGDLICFYSSMAEPKVGDPVDGIFVDDEIMYERHVAEWQARLSDRKGRFIWASIPSSKNPALENLCEKADMQEGRPNPDTEKFTLTFTANKFIDENEKRKRREGWGEEDLRIRDLGEFTTDKIVMFPEFSRKNHCIPSNRKEADALDQFLVGRQYEVPHEWPHYLIVDPGHVKPSALLATVPPPDRFGDFIVCCNEVLLPGSNALQFAHACFPKVVHRYLHAMVIDYRAGRKTPEGFHHTIKQQYAEAFEEAGIISAISGSSFVNSSDDKLGGIGLIREALRERKFNTPPRLRFIRHLTQETQRQLQRYRKKRVANSEPEDTAADRQKDDLVDCVRYLVSYDPEYVVPKNMPSLGSDAYRFFQRMQKSHGGGSKSGSQSVTMGMP